MVYQPVFRRLAPDKCHRELPLLCQWTARPSWLFSAVTEVMKDVRLPRATGAAGRRRS